MNSSVRQPSSTIRSSEMHSWMQRMHTTVACSSVMASGMNCAVASSVLIATLWMEVTVV